jgi:hypothetical protein
MRLTAEDAEQVAVIAWADSNLDLYPELAWLFHPANGGLRSFQTAARMKLLGVRPGVSDLILLVARGEYHGLVVEMKAVSARGRKGTLQPSQKAFMEFERAAGYCVHICYDRFSAIRALTDYLEQKEPPGGGSLHHDTER